MADRTIRVVMDFERRCQHAEIRCRACRRTVILPPKLVAKAYGAMTLLTDAERRSRCRECGARGATIKGVFREYHG
ncbi:hypothetical protein [Sphingomonas sp. Y38-1Y]|jgi:hypothetical protein|uniref:hypothetical protein n=1 Tax=Sphingomonas sp. Y38-1Y TaxID=3078265 RepID=UPI0028E4529F|nr:hypothetical protein [Sphingomonas sp. Y38-1Y]